MKKSDLYIGLGYLILGTVLFGLALFTQYRLESLLWGFGGACFGSGVVTTCKYLHWSKPENQSEYNEKLRIEKIEMEDERQIMIRDKSGCITYKIMLMLYCGLIVVFSILNAIGYIHPISQYLVIAFVTLLIFQYICGIIVFKYLNKKL